MSTQAHYIRQVAEWSGEALSNASGLATFTFPPGLFIGALPIITATLLAGNDAQTYFVQVISVTLLGCVVEVTRAGSVNIVGIGAMGPPTAVPNVLIEVHARARG